MYPWVKSLLFFKKCPLTTFVLERFYIVYIKEGKDKVVTAIVSDLLYK